jgi:hypothetical protein
MEVTTELIFERLERWKLLFLMTLLSRSITEPFSVVETLEDYPGMEDEIDFKILDFCEDLNEYQTLRLIAQIAQYLAHDEQMHQQLELPIAM